MSTSTIQQNEIILADALYSRAQLKKFGIGDDMMQELRAAGVAKGYLGRKAWYYGKEIIEFWSKKRTRSN